MTNGMTNGWTNFSTGGDPPIHSHLGDGGLTPSTAAASESSMAEPRAYLNPDPGADAWRVEVAARLERYRTRRKPRTPRYPSLLLPFDAPESWSRPAPPTGPAPGATAPATTDFAWQTFKSERGIDQHEEQSSEVTSEQFPEQFPEISAKVIEFPRFAAIPVFHRSDLADPVFDCARPRIVEAPEILPPPPALGGMLIGPARQEPAERGAQFPVPSPSASASISRRALAALVDGAILATALAAFGAIFLRLNPSLTPHLNLSLNSVRGTLPLLSGLKLSGSPLSEPALAGALAAIAVLLWAAYKFFFVVHTGSTPGLRAARLRLAGFDGSPLNRRARRWRVLASFLSAFSAGLGYLWCLLDPSGLCWHDRITHTQIQSAAEPE